MNSENKAGSLKSFLARVFVPGLLCLFFSSCKQVECGRYYRFVEDRDSYEEIVGWADRNVFSRKFSTDELRAGRLVGPGRRALPRSVHRNVPIDSENIEVRIVDSNWSSPDLIFVGSRRLQGVLISRREIDRSLDGANLSIRLMEGSKGRVAVMCYGEREIMQKNNTGPK